MKLEQTTDVGVDGTYHVLEAVIHTIKVWLNSLKERCSLRVCSLEHTTVQTRQVILEILKEAVLTS